MKLEKCGIRRLHEQCVCYEHMQGFPHLVETTWEAHILWKAVLTDFDVTAVIWQA